MNPDMPYRRSYSSWEPIRSAAYKARKDNRNNRLKNKHRGH